MQMNFSKLIRNLLKQGKYRRAWNRFVRMTACVVVFCTVYALILPALTAEEPTFCGLAEHTHTASCYSEEDSLTCTQEEHTHTLACYSNPEADTETAQVWEATLPGLSGDLRMDLLAAAKSQLGYAESEENYQVREDNSLDGYTRYGAWAENPYGAWNLYFAQFCMHYAEVPAQWFAGAETDAVLRALLQANDRLIPAEGTLPQAGDLAFLERGGVNAVGIVERADSGYVTLILGDEANAVQSVTCPVRDLTYYGCIGKDLPVPQETEVPEMTEAAEPTESTEEAQPTEETVPETTAEETVPEATEVPQEPVEEPTVPASEESDGFGATADLVWQTTNMRQSAGTDQVKAGTGIDMKDMIETATMQHRARNASGNDPWINLNSGDQVQADDQIRGIISYRVPAKTLSADNRTLCYQFPNGMKLQKVENGIVYDTNGQEVGTYTIDDTGKAFINFNDNYVSENQKGQPIDGRLTFEGSLNQSAVDSNGKLEMLFNEKCKIELQVEESKPVSGDITVDKAVQTETASGQLEYTVVVSSTNGTSGPVTVTDNMQYQSFSPDLAQEMKVVNENGNPVAFTLHTKENEFSKFKLELPAMGKNSEYVITYPTHSEINTHGMTLSNKAAATSVDSENGPINAGDDASVPYNMISKKGTYDEETQMLFWTIQINKDKRDISGWTLADRYQEGGTWHPYEGNVAMKDSQGTVTTVKLPYTFPEGSTDAYEVTYSIPRGRLSIGENVAYNEARLVKNGKIIASASGKVGIGTFTPIVKEGGEIINRDANGNAILPWTVTLDFRADSTHHGYLGFRDLLLQSEDVRQYFTKAQLEAVRIAVIEAFGKIGLKTEAWGVYTDAAQGNPSAWPSESDTDGQYVGYYFGVPGDIPKGSLLEFSYESTGILGKGRQPLVFPNRFHLYGDYDEAEISYVPEMLTIEKIDPSNPGESNTEHFMHELDNGRLSWVIRSFVPENLRHGSAVITEELPAHADLDELSLQISLGGNPVTQIFTFGTGNTAQVRFYDAGGKMYEATAVKDGKLVTVTIPEGLMAAANGYFEVGVTLKIRENEVDWQESETSRSAAFANKATVVVNNETTQDIQTQVVTQNDLHGVISKHGTKIKDTNLVEYNIVVNPKGVDLVPGGDTMVLEDILTFDNKDNTIHASLVPGSVKVVKYGTDQQLKAPPTYENQSAGNMEKHVLHITVPDRQPLLVTYKYRFYGKLDANTTAGNTASINSVATDDVENHDEIMVQIQESGAVAQLRGITMIKVDQMDFDIFLSGVKFKLRGWNGSEYVDLAELVTDSEGKIQLNKDRVKSLTYNTAYQLVEMETNPAYFLDPAVYEFCIQHEDTATYPLKLPADFNGHHHHDGDQHFITNEKNVTALRMEKTWLDEKSLPLEMPGVEEITVQVYRQTNAQDKQLYNEYTVKASDGWKLELTDLPAAAQNADGTKGGKYLYTVEEVKVPGFSVTYENNEGINEGTIHLTNKKEASYELPQTGGVGRLPSLLAGAGCVALSLTLLGRKKKKM